MTRVLAALLAAAVLGAGVGVGGWFVGEGFKKGRATARFVTVKGLSERQVAADYAIWPLRMLATGNDLRNLFYVETMNNVLFTILTVHCRDYHDDFCN